MGKDRECPVEIKAVGGVERTREDTNALKYPGKHFLKQAESWDCDPLPVVTRPLCYGRPGVTTSRAAQTSPVSG